MDLLEVSYMNLLKVIKNAIKNLNLLKKLMQLN